jgi:cytochrome c553
MIRQRLHFAPRRIDTWLMLGFASLTAVATCGNAHADADAPASAKVCQRCHGVNGEGNAPAAIPRLAGQSAEYLRKQLEDYASGDRANPIMQNFAKPLTNADIEAVAAYFSTAGAPRTVIASTAAPGVLELGQQLARQGSELKRVQACDGCHGPDGVGVPHAAPYLAGQSVEYLTSALTSFEKRTRKNDPGKLMTSVAAQLDAADIAAAAAYFSSLPSNAR